MQQNKHHYHPLLTAISFLVLLFVAKTNNTFGKTPDTLNINAFVVVVDFNKFDDEKQELQADFVVNLSWKNIKPTDPKGADTLDANLNWIKNFQILNETHLIKKGTETEINPDGTISLRSRFLGTIREDIVFKDFPFDRQIFKINVVFPTNKHFLLHLKNIKDKDVGPLTIANWAINKSSLKPYELSVNNRDLYGFSYQVQVKRKRNYYLLKVFMPIAIIVFMSWTVFWIDPEKIEAQLTVSSTAILSLIAFLFSLSYTIPKIPYLTKLDVFLYSSLILVFMALVESVYTSNLTGKGKHKTAKKTDLLARYFFPGTYFIILCLIYFI